VATTMRMKFERLELARIPGRAKSLAGNEHGAHEDDVDLAGIVARLRNVQKTQAPQAPLSGATVSPVKQAGEPDFRRPATVHQATLDVESNFGFTSNSASRFGNRTRQD
ncbi:MAG: hypothetical protein KDB23_30525, partial [Planctomycetales bacterium]|nr:hypothetical protein [Planctomycetales bacterium]